MNRAHQNDSLTSFQFEGVIASSIVAHFMRRENALDGDSREVLKTVEASVWIEMSSMISQRF